MSNNIKTKDEVLEFLCKHAPNAPIWQCVELADDVERMRKEEYRLGCIIAILSTRLLSENGEIHPDFVEGRPAWQVALKEVQFRNSWVSCGPLAGAMERLLEEFDKKNI